MTNAKIDENGVPTLISINENNYSVITRVLGSPTTHAISVDDNFDSIFPTNSMTISRDENSHHCLYGVSSADGETPILITVRNSGRLNVNGS